MNEDNEREVGRGFPRKKFASGVPLKPSGLRSPLASLAGCTRMPLLFILERIQIGRDERGFQVPCSLKAFSGRV